MYNFLFAPSTGKRGRGKVKGVKGTGKEARGKGKGDGKGRRKKESKK